MKEIIEIIKEKPVKFFSKLKPLYRNELVGSVLIPHFLETLPTAWVNSAHRLNIGFKTNPYKANILGNIMHTLQLNYPDDIKNPYKTAKEIFLLYGDRIIAYMYNKYINGELGDIKKPWHTIDEAFKEQVLRDFVIDINWGYQNKHKYFILSTITPGLLYKELANTFEEARKIQERVGISGYTGIHQPRKG